MKKTAAIILNRNLPDLTNELGQWILKNHSDLVDLYVVENGSDPTQFSKFANIYFTESYGPAKGINEALKSLIIKKYDYFWINFNDARYKKVEFIKTAIDIMDNSKQVGIVTAFWPGNIRSMGKIKDLELISFFDPLGFVVSRRALEICQSFSEINLDPLWDSSNFSNHYNILGTAKAIYRAGMCIVADKKFEIYEREEVAAENSTAARGFNDKEWKETIGPNDLQKWLNRSFPGLPPDLKVKKQKIIKQIESLARENYSGSMNSYLHQGIISLGKQVLQRLALLPSSTLSIYISRIRNFPE